MKRLPSPLWHLPLLALAATMLMPLAFMVSTALSSHETSLRAVDSFLELLWPAEWNWKNFAAVWEVVPFLRFYINSLVVAVLATAGQVFTSACAAYAFSRLEWRWRDRLFLAYLATMMVPGVVTMLPNFIAMKLLPEVLGALFPGVNWLDFRYLGGTTDAPFFGRLAGLDSYFALIVPAMFSAYGTFLLRQFFMGLPRDLDEAAMIDGCGHGGIFFRIILPLSLPALATLTIFTFMGNWGSFLWPLVVTNSKALQTLPLGLQAFQGQYGFEWHLMMAASLLMLAPIVLIFLFCQRFFVSGLTTGAVKG
ncbi:MAG TPA: carbohydrate ABC transporter permease [Chthoniobacteraceae bacterium]|nr:carbohydrate ABC transporter permease [Chthoniobacteraceae bacterium]